MWRCAEWLKKFAVTGLAALAIATGSYAAEPIEEAKTGPTKVLRLTVNEQVISPVVADYLKKGIEKADEDGYDAVVLELDTPGGLLSSTHTMVKSILNAPLPVLVYVSPTGARAASAGVFITMSGHVAAMAPASRIGAAHPVNTDGTWEPDAEDAPETGDSEGDLAKEAAKQVQDKHSTMNEKVMNDTLRGIEGIASHRNRNVEWARQAVIKSVSVGAEEAVKLNVVDFIANDKAELLQKAEGKQVEVKGNKQTLSFKQVEWEPYPFTWQQEFLSILVNPLFSYFLLMIGFYGLLYEITHPGILFPGLVGTLCIVLGLVGMQTLSLDMAGVGLSALGICLLGAELFTPAFGALLLGGLTCLAIGLAMVFQTGGDPYLQSLLWPAVAMLLPIVGLMIFLIIRALKALRQPIPSTNDRLIEATGRATMDFDEQGEGKVMVAGEIWNALVEPPKALAKDSAIKVVGRDANKSTWLVVELVE